MASESKSESADPRAAMEAARVEVVEVEKEIQSIKSTLRTLDSSSSSDDDDNFLKISVSKVRLKYLSTLSVCRKNFQS